MNAERAIVTLKDFLLGIVAPIIVGIVLQLIGPIKVLPASSLSYFLQWLVISGILLGAIYSVKLGVNRFRARKEKGEREARERCERAEEELERKRVALISHLNSILSSWSYLSQPGQEPLLESVKGTYDHLVLEGLRELDLMPQELLDLDTEIELAREKVRLYLIEISKLLHQSVEEAQRFARVWNRQR